MRLRSKSFTRSSAPSPEVTVPFCLVPSPEFSQALWYSLPDHLCGKVDSVDFFNVDRSNALPKLAPPLDGKDLLKLIFL